MCKQAGKIAKTQIVFKIGGLTEENFAYAQQEIKVVLVSSAHYGVVKLALQILIFGSGLGLGLAVVELVDDSLDINSLGCLMLMFAGSGQAGLEFYLSKPDLS
ncbi:hypothetical protein BY996DRAFT_6408250 [Phakopsora pachyrhizi]|nr:hypothetical protein BY996DRAFT_6408250 [Phakopsora pachyrhizi]